jgi:hypothetical protein
MTSTGKVAHSTNMDSYAVNQELSLSAGEQPDAKEPTRHEGCQNMIKL